MATLQVNWRPGTMGVYESIWSLRRKFSFLNKIDKGATSEAIRAAKGRVDGDIDLNNPMLRSLGEPLRLFHDCSLSRFLLPKEITGSKRTFSVEKFRYCEVCVARGYHSPIQQLSWIELCPIHQHPLKDLCGACGKTISIRSWEDGKPNSRFSKNQHDGCDCDLWQAMYSQHWPPGIKPSEAKRIGDYLRWLDELKFVPEAKSADAALRQLCISNCSASCQEELFHIWRQILPPPRLVEEFLSANSTPQAVVERITFPTEARTEAALHLVMMYGYDRFKGGVISQLAHREEKGTWEHYAKRVQRRLAKTGHGNCHQIIQAGVKRRFLKSLIIDIAAEFKWICPRSELFRLIRCHALICELDRKPSLIGREIYGDSLVTWFDEELIKVGLADIVTYVDKLRFRRSINKRFGKALYSKAVWSPELSRFSSLLVMASHVAAISYLLTTYTDFFRYKRTYRAKWCSALQSSQVRWPYVLTKIEDRCVLHITTWMRNRPIKEFSFERLFDEHPANIKTEIRRVNRAVIKLERRALDERGKEFELLERTFKKRDSS